jgi:hypothetical protein
VVGAAFAAELVLQPGSEGKDSQIVSTQPSYNWGTRIYLMDNWAGGAAVRSPVEFEGLSAIPKGSTINSAELQLYHRANTPSDYFGIYRITASWQEMTVTWSNQPAHYATAYAKVMVTGPNYYKWDIKTLVAEWVAGTYTNYGFYLKRDNEAGSSWPYFISSDHTTTDWRPKLTVDYTPSAVAPTSVGKVKALFE